jgi:hypothetical protein
MLPADRVIAFRVGNESPFKLFYTRAGASPFAASSRGILKSAVEDAHRSVVSRFLSQIEATESSPHLLM